MTGFYVSLVFTGILLVVFSLALIFIDKKRAVNVLRDYDEKKQELVEIINDAEQMIDELNRFSEYIVNQMDLKSQEISTNLKLAEEKSNYLGERMVKLYGELGSRKGNMSDNRTALYKMASGETGAPAEIKRDKVIPIKNKYAEVIRLSQEGISGPEIARIMSMGRGEVELILGIRG